MSIASAAWPASTVAASIVSSESGLPGRNEKMPSEATTSVGSATGTIAPVQPFSRNGTSAGRNCSSPSRPGVEPEGAPLAEQPLHVPLAERNGLREDRAHRLRERGLPHVDGVRYELLAPVVGHPHDRRVEVEHLDDGARQRLERLVEAEALREGARDLVERANPARGRAFGREGRLALLAEPRRLLVELRVLDGDRELSRERRQQRRLVLARRGPAGRIRREQADDVAARHERNGERRADSGLPRGSRDRREPWILPDVRDLEHGTLARRPEREVEQPVGDTRVRPDETATRRLLELALAGAAEIDGDTVHVEQLGDALDRDLERVRDGELRRRLHDHLEQRPRALELEREPARPLAGAQRVCGADAERREPGELLRLRLLARADGTAAERPAAGVPGGAWSRRRSPAGARLHER